MPWNPEDLSRLTAALRAGEPAIFPTDTVYGLGVAVRYASDPYAIAELKGRDRAKPIAWLVGSVDDLDRYGADLSPEVRAFAAGHWPGPFTLVVKASSAVPEAYRGVSDTIGLRMPAQPDLLHLLEVLDSPLATSSANRAGQEAPRSAEALDGSLLSRVESLLQPGEMIGGPASTVLDFTEDEPKVIRP